MSGNDNDTVHFNLKLKRKERRDFGIAVKEVHDKTMQDVLLAFVLSYIDNPYQFNIKTILGIKNNGGKEHI